jgi:hypothetical protein
VDTFTSPPRPKSRFERIRQRTFCASAEIKEDGGPWAGGETMHNRWVVQKRHEMLTVIIYSVVGLIVVMTLVTLANYAIYANSLHK